MKRSTILLKSFSSLIVVGWALIKVLFGIAIAASSHSIPFEDRIDAEDKGEFAIVKGLLVLVLIWLPWHKWIRLKKSTSDSAAQ